MKSLFLTLSIIILMCYSGTAQTQSNIQNNSSINNSAIWKPNTADMDRLVNDCGGLDPSKYGDCLESVMNKTGATQQAVSFTKMLNGNGYMQNFFESGMIDAASVYYPFRENDKSGLYLVNGKPKAIDVDDMSYLDINEMESNVVYSEMFKKYPHVTILPGSRGGSDSFKSGTWGKNGQRMLINYRLKDGCRNCELLGYATFAFNFDSTGKFVNTTLAKVEKIYSDNVSSVNSSAPSRVFSDPSETIKIQKGESFAIALKTNPTSGYKWELAKSLNSSILTLIGTDEVKSYYSKLPNAGGKIVFRFKAAGTGNTTIELKYVKSWENSTPGEKLSFKVNVY